ncbi:MauE/DoxX family redox-associated membrane protein [Janibacter massiliensis]|uniref:MauE/DoxX family redox-associated membrane protein n=1 Tax=Janibacter massiliensis TaxID=2058291 RepID=UPI000D0F69D6|nr:MauE/DoxX family redox-associated membrane protein [Janibacter massiliensis]
MTTERRERVLDLVGLLARLVLGGVLIVAGALKVGNPLGSARAVQAYRLLPFEVAEVVGYALPYVEIVLGVLLVLGLFTRASALLGALLMIAFIIGIGSAWARGLSIDCGCFGGGGAVAEGETKYGSEIARDVVFALCGLWLVWRPRALLSLERRVFGAA